MNKPERQLLNASEAIALTINRLKVGVISVYPITPQTKIVEKLAGLKTDNSGKYEFIRAESEFSAASIVLGASAAGVRAYTATGSQGLLMMLEVLYNIAGLRLPVVLTCANRSVSAPLNIWNDHQDAMTTRDAGWLMFFAENNQEAVDQHILAYKLAEKLNLPAMVNVDGFILTHMSEAVSLPSPTAIKKFLPDLKAANNRLDVKKPQTIGHLVGPQDFFKFRRQLDRDLTKALKIINQEYALCQKILNHKQNSPKTLIDNGLIEFYGSAKAKTVFVALGSVVGTIKAAIDMDQQNFLGLNQAAVLKIKTFRPFPSEAIKNLLKGKKVIIINKAISAGFLPPLSAAIAALNIIKADLQHVVAGLGGQDITIEHISELLKSKFDGKIRWLE